MNKKLDDTEIEELEFHQHKRPISIKNIDINKVVVCHRLPFSEQNFKYFIGYKDDKKIRPFCIFCTKVSVHIE